MLADINQMVSTIAENTNADKLVQLPLGDQMRNPENPTEKTSFTLLGEVVFKDIVATINRGIRPKLKPATVKRKKSRKPLIDTGRLKGSITHEVRGAS